jgi:regulator of protease activity HflC (stomatin/prohibitin superfamily)
VLCFFKISHTPDEFWAQPAYPFVDQLTTTTKMACCGCFACVEESEVVMVENCGKYSRQLGPGCNIVCCCVGDVVAGKVSVRLQQLDISCETKTHDNVFVTLTINVQFKVIHDREHIAFYSLEDYQKQIRAYVFDTVRSAVPKITLNTVFAQKEDIAIACKRELANSMEEYGWEIIQVLIADIDPDMKVKNAMNEINTAQRLRVAAVDRAEADKILAVKKAEAEAESKYLGGVGIARQRKAIAEGMRSSVLAFTEGVPESNPQEIMDLVLVTQYFDTLKELGENPRSSTVFLPGTSGPETPADSIRQCMLEAHASMSGQAQARAVMAQRRQ